MSGEVDAIVAAAFAAAEPDLIDPESWYVVRDSAGGFMTLSPRPDSELLTPRRVRGTVTVYDADSFVAYWAKHAHGFSDVFADPRRNRIVGVIDAHGGAAGSPGHQEHRALLVCEHTPAWEAWAALDGKLLSQQEFAEHIESRSIDVQRPTAAEMLELAQTFEATTRVDFKAVEVLSSGQRGIRYEETTSAKAGQTGQIDIPATFDVALQPFEGSLAYKVTARLRYRIREGRLSIGYALVRPEDVLREAFADVVQAVSAGIDRTILSGVPAGTSSGRWLP